MQTTPTFFQKCVLNFSALSPLTSKNLLLTITWHKQFILIVEFSVSNEMEHPSYVTKDFVNLPQIIQIILFKTPEFKRLPSLLNF